MNVKIIKKKKNTTIAVKQQLNNNTLESKITCVHFIIRSSLIGCTSADKILYTSAKIPSLITDAIHTKNIPMTNTTIAAFLIRCAHDITESTAPVKTSPTTGTTFIINLAVFAVAPSKSGAEILCNVKTPIKDNEIIFKLQLTIVFISSAKFVIRFLPVMLFIIWMLTNIVTSGSIKFMIKTMASAKKNIIGLKILLA